MHRSRAFAAVVAVLLANACGHAARAAEIEYAVVHRALAAARDVARYPSLRAVQRVESKHAGVSPETIALAIRTRAGRIAIPVGDDGTVSLPIDDALLAENPVVVTNQPAGSLTLTLSIELAPPAGAKLRVADVAAALDDADAVLAARDTNARVRGVELRFVPGEPAPVTLRGDGERTLVPDLDGRVVLMRDPELGPLYDEIELAARPVRILPFLDR